MKMKFLCCRYKIVYICEQVKINGKVLKHQQTVLNKSCSFAYIFIDGMRFLLFNFGRH